MQAGDQAQGHHHDVQRPAGRPARACARCGPATSSTRSTTCPRAVKVRVLRYWFPPDGKGMVDNDLMVVPDRRQEPGARPPVHQLHARRQERARRTSATSATSRRSDASTPDSWSPDGYVPENLATAVVQQEWLRRRATAARAAAGGGRAWHRSGRSSRPVADDERRRGADPEASQQPPVAGSWPLPGHRLARPALRRAALRRARRSSSAGSTRSSARRCRSGTRCSGTPPSSSYVFDAHRRAGRLLRPGAAPHRRSTSRWPACSAC